MSHSSSASDEVQKATADLRRLACADIQLNLKSVAYPLFDKRRGKSYVGRTSCPYGGKLFMLASASDRLAKTGFNKAAVTWWILLGRSPGNEIGGRRLAQEGVRSIPRRESLALLPARAVEEFQQC